MEGNKDELIINQQRQIEKEIEQNINMIENSAPITILLDEYVEDEVYGAKVRFLSRNYKEIRKVRPDGNCFFRGFAYAFFEYMIHHKDKFAEMKEKLENSKDFLVKIGFPQFTLEDFHDTFMEVINRVDPNTQDVNTALEELHKHFNDAGYSNYVVVYLRLLTSARLQKDQDFYKHFIDGSYPTIIDFVRQEVEPMYKESDHIHIIALSSELNGGVRVEYLDRGDGDQTTSHEFPEGKEPIVFLLYRPGHYDILYPK